MVGAGVVSAGVGVDTMVNNENKKQTIIPLMSRVASKNCSTNTSYLSELFVIFKLLHM